MPILLTPKQVHLVLLSVPRPTGVSYHGVRDLSSSVLTRWLLNTRPLRGNDESRREVTPETPETPRECIDGAGEAKGSMLLMGKPSNVFSVMVGADTMKLRRVWG